MKSDYLKDSQDGVCDEEEIGQEKTSITQMMPV